MDSGSETPCQHATPSRVWTKWLPRCPCFLYWDLKAWARTLSSAPSLEFLLSLRQSTVEGGCLGLALLSLLSPDAFSQKLSCHSSLTCRGKQWLSLASDQPSALCCACQRLEAPWLGVRSPLSEPARLQTVLPPSAHAGNQTKPGLFPG